MVKVLQVCGGVSGDDVASISLVSGDLSDPVRRRTAGRNEILEDAGAGGREHLLTTTHLGCCSIEVLESP